MGRKKKKPIKVFCFYCEREFDDENVLVEHQKAKHFKCHVCYKQLSSGGGLKIHLQQVHRELLDKVPNALHGRDLPNIDIFGMQGIPAEILAAHYGEDPLAKQVNVGVTYPAPLPYGAVPHMYTPVGLQPIIWSHPPRPQPWAPQVPAYPTAYPMQAYPLPAYPMPAYPMPPAPPAPVQVQPQPSSSIQNVTKPSIHITAPGLQPSIPSSTSLPTSHPLFPINSKSSAPLQNPPSLSTIPPSMTPASSPTVLNSSLELKSMSNIAQGSQGDAANKKSHMNASGPNTGVPSIGCPPVRSDNAPVAPTMIFEVYLLWEDEVMSMEERRLGLPKYQVHETSQMEYTGPAKKIYKGLPVRLTF